VFLRLRGLRGISLLLIRLRYPYASASSNSVSRGQTHWIDGTPLLTKRSDQGATVVAMTAICAFRPAGIGVKRTLRSAAPDASIGRIASLQGPPRERPQSAP
jgi:hypothetical protein